MLENLAKLNEFASRHVGGRQAAARTYRSDGTTTTSSLNRLKRPANPLFLKSVSAFEFWALRIYGHFPMQTSCPQHQTEKSWDSKREGSEWPRFVCLRPWTSCVEAVFSAREALAN